MSTSGLLSTSAPSDIRGELEGGKFILPQEEKASGRVFCAPHLFPEWAGMERHRQSDPSIYGDGTRSKEQDKRKYFCHSKGGHNILE